MPEPVHIDLRNLTEEHVNEALGSLGVCHYTGPCIIGTLVPEEQRERLDNVNDELPGELQHYPTIGQLITHGFVTVPEGQAEHAEALQAAFDSGEPEEFARELGRVRGELDA